MLFLLTLGKGFFERPVSKISGIFCKVSFREIMRKHYSGKSNGLFRDVSANIRKNSFLNSPNVFLRQTSFRKNT